MVVFTPRRSRPGEIVPQLNGVFEDDVLLLHLTASSRLAISASRLAPGPIDADGLRFEEGRLVDSEAWDL